jgi:prepilin peptidase CpaA
MFMTIGTSEIALGALLASLLVTAAVTDWRRREIDNWLNGVIALAAPLFWWVTGLALWPDMAIQCAVAAAVFALFAGMFALGAMGGGDVKLLGALSLWLAPLDVMRMLIVMSLIGGALTIVMLIRQKMLKLTGKPEIPYGIAIALAGIWSIYERYINHFTQ